MEDSIFLKYRKEIKEILQIDDFAVDILKGESTRLTVLSMPAKHPFLFHGLLAIVTNVLFPLRGLKRKVCSQGDDFVFISCPDVVFRTKTIHLIAGTQKYCIIYLPNFHIPTALQYHKYFKEHHIKAFFPTIKLKYVFQARKRIKCLKRELKDVENSFENTKIWSVFSSFLLYDQVVKKYMEQIGQFHGKWILEHQKFYFLASVANLHARGIESTMLQHGIFFQPVYDFIPLLCDKVLCCSEREKKIYIDNGTAENRVEVLGAPLQTLQVIDNISVVSKRYDLLVMMTLINDENLELTCEVLEFIKNSYRNVLVRMRPRSRKEDEALLANILKDMTISKIGTPIADDIKCCSKVVSFSMDANIEVTKLHKPFIYIWDGAETDFTGELNFATKDNYQCEIRKLMESDFYSSFSEDQYKSILGETNIEYLCEKFGKYVKSKI